MRASSKRHRPLTVVFLGPQGSGKGTQATRLAEKHGLHHLEAGRMLRMATRKRTPFARRVARYINNGNLVPFAWVLRMFADQLKTMDPHAGVILDGTPRRLVEAKALLRMLQREFGREVDHVFYLTIPMREAVRRLDKRWVCTKEGHSLTMGRNIHAPTDRCPHDGSHLAQRDDDKPAAIKKRLSIFRNETKPVITFFRARGVLTRIDGDKSITAVARDVERIFRTKVRPRHAQRATR